LIAEPAFQEAWEAQAFALATALQERGLVTRAEWAEALGGQIAAAGDSDDGTAYYHYWLAALETILSKKGLVAQTELIRRKAEWEQAARATPHGQPIELRAGRKVPR